MLFEKSAPQGFEMALFNKLNIPERKRISHPSDHLNFHILVDHRSNYVVHRIAETIDMDWLIVHHSLDIPGAGVWAPRFHPFEADETVRAMARGKPGGRQIPTR
jgi:hypothetical protein